VQREGVSDHGGWCQRQQAVVSSDPTEQQGSVGYGDAFIMDLQFASSCDSLGPDWMYLQN
jgi:hypothetical protein